MGAKTKAGPTEERPWGSFTVLEEGQGYKVKRITVKPGQILSLQSHQRRAEHWTVVQGTGKITVGAKVVTLGPNETIHIPKEAKHRIENPGKEVLQFIEVQVGDYLGEDDIVRFEDVYGRV
ncbi:MAG: phosphomannose isomerase type II C-terminal cupin domain [Deltaproteobacteria bacterium]|nr:phosphomannose isomerase type II C-terminal cupin domain [Deltaproteobacteria bacterium]MBI4223526.1 phosphomannose isomerase type II C-terminal cupin domain [Deltaproteobacteria bacterium]